MNDFTGSEIREPHHPDHMIDHLDFHAQLQRMYTSTNKVCIIYSTPLGCYRELIRSDQFIYLVRRSGVLDASILV